MRRPPIYGPELWAERAEAGWSHWDLWFCVVCLTETEDDWAALEEEIIARDRRGSVMSRTWERKRSHLLDLRARLDAAGLSAADLAADHLDDMPELPAGHGPGGHRNRRAQDRTDDPARLLALWRAVLTACVEAFLNGLRDSDGAVGTFLGDALETYTLLPWRETEINPAVYWADLCEWCIWEDWGIRHRRDTAPFAARA
jgi:hypothetical protein